MSAVSNKAVTIVTSIHPDFDKRVWRHARGLAELGYHVRLICPWRVESGSTVEGVELITFALKKSFFNRLTRIPWTVLRVLHALGGKAGIIHFHDLDLLPWMAMLSLRRRVVYDVHENYPDEVRNRAAIPRYLQGVAYHSVKWGQWIFARLIKNIVLVTPFQEQGFPGNGFNKVYVKNYASRSLLDSVKDDYAERDNIVAFVGAQHDNNGSFVLLSIAELCRNRGLNCRFIAPDLFPRSEVRDRYLQIRSEKGLAETVELFPPVRPQEIMSVLNQCRIAINPNLRVEQQIRGIHTKMYEFMAAGVPVLASDLPHQKELLDASNGGISLPPEDPGRFADTIDQLLSDEATALQLGKNGQQYFLEHCTWESQMKTLAGFYTLVLEQ